MAKVTAPLLSFEARGTIAKTQTYASWRGVPYVRQHVIPSNPRSADQTKTRVAFTWLMSFWKLMSPDAQAPWLAFISGKPLTGRNAIASKNISQLRSATDLTDLIASPGAKGGTAPASATAAAATGTVTVTMAAPALPTGWAVQSAVAILLPQQDPQTDTQFVSRTATDEMTPYAPSFATVATGDYYWAAWFVYTKPDGSLAYGPDIHGEVTVS